MSIQESGEMYIENIYVLTKQNDKVRSIDVCERMGYSKPSVSRAISLLKSGGYVTMNSEGHLSLTEEGHSVAYKIYERHNVLTEFLIRLGVNKAIASEDACKMEHDISDESLAAIKRFIEK